MMLHDTVWGAMSEAFESVEGPLVDRMMCAMDAAEREGGDVRGAQSAAIKIAVSKRPEKPWEGVIYDFKVYDHPEPLQELRRLVRVRQAHDRTNAAHKLLFEDHIDDDAIAQSMKQFNDALSHIPNLDSKLQHQCAYGLSLLKKGRIHDALSLFREVFEADARWREVIARVVRVNPDRPYARELRQLLSQ